MSNSSDKDAATTWLNRYQRKPNSEKSPVPLKACPWCGTPFKPESFIIWPDKAKAQNLVLKCENAACDFTRNNFLPIVVVDEPIYRRLPAFLIATVDKFAALPWVGQSGAFFGHVDRYDPERGFYGASEPGQGRPLGNGHQLDPPDLIIQDELHLISGPLGTVAGLYEAAIDLLASRGKGSIAFARRSSPRRRPSGARRARSAACLIANAPRCSRRRASIGAKAFSPTRCRRRRSRRVSISGWQARDAAPSCCFCAHCRRSFRAPKPSARRQQQAPAILRIRI